MKPITTGSRRLLCWIGLAVLLMAAAGHSPAAEPASPAAPMGQLKIEGGAIERLWLMKRIGHDNAYDASKVLVFDRPGASVTVSAGQYLASIALQGGYTSHLHIQSDDGRVAKVQPDAAWMTVSPDEPCTLKAGSPLKLVPLAYRQGRTVRLMYELLDAQGRRYYPSAPPRPVPQFTIYQGDREIASSQSMSLEYG
jgi:hypothetical protein